MQGQIGELDAVGALRFLLLMSEVVEVAAPDVDRIALRDLHVGSAVAAVDVPGMMDDDVVAGVERLLRLPHELTRDLRRELTSAYAKRVNSGVTGLAFAGTQRTASYDDRVDARLVASLGRATQWLEVKGEIRRLGKTRAGRLTGKILDPKTWRSVSFEAGAALEDDLAPMLFQDVALSGPSEVDSDGRPTRMVVERFRDATGRTRLTDFDPGDTPLDAVDARRRLIDLRRD